MIFDSCKKAHSKSCAINHTTENRLLKRQFEWIFLIIAMDILDETALSELFARKVLQYKTYPQKFF